MKQRKRQYAALWLILCLLLGVVSPASAEDVRAAGYVTYGKASQYYKGSTYYKKLTNVFLTGDQRQDLVNVAASQVGYHEGNSGKELNGENKKGPKDYTEYAAGWNSKKQGLWWCATFVSWCGMVAQIPSKVLYRSAGATQMKNKMTHMLTSQLGSYVPRPGDLIFLKGTEPEKSGHVGIIEWYDKTKKQIHTIEGNLSDGVTRATRKLSEVKWIGIPAYTGESTTGKPSISIRNGTGGKEISISAVSGAEIWYSLDKGTYQKYTKAVPVKTAGSHSVSAFAMKNGLSASAPVSQTFSVSRSVSPSFRTAEDASGVVVTLESSQSGAQIWYSLDGVRWNVYTNPFRLTATATVRYYGAAAGCADSQTESRTVMITQPSVPELTRKNSSDCLAVGDSALLSWSGVSNAKEYILNVYKDGILKDTQTVATTAAAVELNGQGDYSFEIAARNSFGTSAYSARVSVRAMPDVKVVFEDYDGTPLSETYTIPYGGSVTAPRAPSRQGYDFQGWDGSCTNVTEDRVITALYEKKSYTVRFCDQDGMTVSNQKILWQESAKAPDMSARTPTGYVFSGWCVEPASECKDYTKVEGNMTLYAAYAWENSNLPVDVEELSVSCMSNGSGQYYQADMELYCSPDQDMRGRIILEIQTAAGTTKAIGTQDITLRAGDTQTAASVKLNSAADGSIARVYVVGLDEDDNTAGAYSRVKSAQIKRDVFYSEWSDWSEDTPSAEDGNIQVETRTQYRYNTKQTAVSTVSRTMAGYSLIDTKSTAGSWSAWQDSAISTVSTDALYRQVETRSVVVKTEYRYYHYCTGNVTGAKYQTSSSNNTSNTVFNKNCSYHSIGVFDAASTVIQKHSDGTGYLYYLKGTGASSYRCANTCYRWYRSAPIETKKTQYRYRDTTYVYTFEKVSGWSEWSDAQPEGSFYETEERVLYRYRTVVDANEALEQDNTQVYTLEGAVDASEGNLEGKTATVLVYKKTNSDPTQSQMEYIDQITLGAGSSYQVSVHPKEDPSETTGDFVVSLAIEGAARLVNAGVIRAPKAGYRVVFMANGEQVSEQTVPEHENAVIPEAPELAGYTFVRWDSTTSNVTENMVVEAVYQPASYVIVYVDAMNGIIELARAGYGEPIAKETPEAPEGYEFQRWDAEKVTGDMVVHAVYKAKTYTVTFVLPDGTEEAKTASYGEGVIPPDTRYLEAPADMSVIGWSTDVTWWEVTEDMTVYPVYAYEETTAAPYAFVECADSEGASDQIVLECDTENADIYYTLDGTEPVLDSSSDMQTTERAADTGGTLRYTEPIPVTGNMSIRAIAIADKKNISEVAELAIDLDSDAMPEEPQYVESVTLNRSAASVTAGDKLWIQASALPGTISQEDIVWESSDPSVAEVTGSGLVTAKKAGSCTITATVCAVNSMSAACAVTVKEQQNNAGGKENTAEIVSLKKPSSVKAVKYGKKKIRLRWKKVAGAAKYKIYRATKKKGKYKCIKTIKKGKTVTFVDSSVKKGKTYYYKIRAYATSGGRTVASAYSRIVRCKR